MYMNFFRKWFSLWVHVEEYGRAGQGADDDVIRRMRIARWLPDATKRTFE